MQASLLEYLEGTASKMPNHVAYADGEGQITFSEVRKKAMCLGTFLAARGYYKEPIITLLDRSVMTPVCYMGVFYAGCFYVPIDMDLPLHRIQIILNTVKARAIIVNAQTRSLLEQLQFDAEICDLEEGTKVSSDVALLEAHAKDRMSSEPAFVIFTSGSTGTPKGVILTHLAVMDGLDDFVETFSIGAGEVLGGQAPLDYIAAIRDIYIPLITGSTALLIPKRLFADTVKLFDFVNRHEVTIICWVASVLSICAELDTFSAASLTTVKKVFFAGSVLPCRHLRVWQQNMPGVLFVNHYGPTEITTSCTYYIADRLVENSDILPIGIPFKNRQVLLLDEADNAVTEVDQVGEICVRGVCLSPGYYGNAQQTETVFRQNPLNTMYPDTIYRTGDFGSYNKEGLLMFRGRKDQQIKHMGHRVELNEIEAVAASYEGIAEACCVYDEGRSLIRLFYSGKEADRVSLIRHFQAYLPKYMIPMKMAWMESLPHMANGKADRKALKASF